ncbi:MAG: AsmA-like C-terminal region-containing protein [Acetobacter sp.]|uniref:AsmA-like C-terminal region-containing protein n=1 Tax=Acetobacter sp. TaxID=440 RepID=UPI003F8E8A42
MHKKLLRIGLIVVACSVGVPLATGGALLVRMTFGPVNITPVVRPFLPLTVQEGAHGHPPAATLTLKHAQIRWNGLHDGLGAPLVLSLRNVQMIKADHSAPDIIEHADATLDPLALARGAIGLRMLDVSGVHLALRRGKDGSVTLAALKPDQNPTQDKTGKTSAIPDFLDITRLSLHNATITMDDQLTGTHWTAAPVEGDVTVTQTDGKYGVTGTGSLTLTGAKSGAKLNLTATGTRMPDKTLQWHIALAPAQPAQFAVLAPALATIKNTVALTADAVFASAPDSTWLLPTALDLTADIGAGPLEAAHSRFLLKHGHAAVHVDLNHQSGTHVPAVLAVKGLTLDLLDPDKPDAPEKGVSIQARGTLNASDLFSPQALAGQVDVDIPHVDFDNIAQFWPTKMAKGGREWVMKNITTGQARDLHVTLALHSPQGWKGLDVTGATGGVDASGLTVHWLRPISPLLGMDAHLSVSDLDTLKITFDHGYQLVNLADKNVGATGVGRVDAGAGSMTIFGLTKKDQTATIATELHGNLRDILALLAEPRLHLLSRHPLSFTAPSGKATAAFTLSLPLESTVTTDQMSVDAHATVTQTHLGNVVMGRAITNGSFKINATTEKMDLSGHAALGGLPADVSYFMDFRSLKPTEISEKAHVLAHITPASAASAGFAAGDHFDGSATLAVDYAKLENKQATVGLNLDLTPARIRIPLWHKAAGRSAKASAQLNLFDGTITGVDKLAASGPNLAVEGHALLQPNKAPELLISSFHIERSQGHARLILPYNTPDKTIQVGVYASMLDLTPLLENDPATPAPAGKAGGGYHVPEAASGTLHGPPGNAWVIDLQSDALLYNYTKPALSMVKGHFEHNGLRLEKMRFSMSGPAPATMHLTPEGAKRSLHVTIPDMGGFLTAFNIMPNVKGGHASLEGTFDDTLASAPFSGVLKVSPFVLTKAPETVLLARNLSLYGWINSRKSPEFEITHLSMPVTFSDGVLRIHDSSTGNDALGATLEGDIDLDHGKLDLDGTVVPIFALNRLPGRLPGIGRLFSPEKNGGLLAMTFNLSGKLDNPDFHVNPLSILLPGLLRKIF